MNIFLPSRYLLPSARFSVSLCRGASSSSALVARTDLLAAPLRCRLISGSSGAVGAAEGKGGGGGGVRGGEEVWRDQSWPDDDDDDDDAARWAVPHPAGQYRELQEGGRHRDVPHALDCALLMRLCLSPQTLPAYHKEHRLQLFCLIRLSVDIRASTLSLSIVHW